jgi:circadian clock protein KaiB
MTPCAAQPSAEAYRLRLIVAGSTPRSRLAIENLRRLCRDSLGGPSDVEIIDIYQQPERAKDYDICAAPTLVRLLPLPVRRIVGDLSRRERVLRALDIRPPLAAGQP